MLEGKALIQDTDMPVKMQLQAMSSASQALDLYDVSDCRSIATHIKKVFISKLLYLEIMFFKFFNLSFLFLFFIFCRSLTWFMAQGGSV